MNWFFVRRIKVIEKLFLFSFVVQDDKEVLAPNSDVTATTTNSGTTTATHGIEVATEFRPVEHPVEPLDNDLPIQCPLPEPSILNVTLVSY